MPSARWLLARAAALYDGEGGADLRAAGRAAWRGGFASGGEWMRLAMGKLRNGCEPVARPELGALGLRKYGGSLLAGLAVGAFCWPLGWVATGVGFAAGFYVFESAHVFLFPAALDGETEPWRASRRMVRASGGRLEALRVVLVLAAVMLTGGFFGRGFVRCWCLGCLAVVVWHEECRSWQRLPLVEEEGAAAVLGLGNAGPWLLRRERVEGGGLKRVLWISDLHWSGWSGEAAERLLECAAALKPDSVLLGGDYADTRAGLEVFRGFLGRLVRVGPVAGTLGNHDRWLGEERVSAVFSEAGASLPEAGLVANGAVQMLHDPAEVEQGEKTAAVFLAGHLHGCQVTFWKRGGTGFPGAWFYRWNVLRGEWNGRPVIVSRGLGDTLPVRWRTPREIILLEGAAS